MEAALKSVLQEHLSDYVKGRALAKADLSSFPLVLRDLQLNEKKVQEAFDEDHESAIQLQSGKIGMVKVTPGWLGNVDVSVSNIELSFSFSATQAMKNAMKPAEADEVYEPQGAAQPGPTGPPGPPPNCPPNFCSKHDTSEKRVKGDPVLKPCKLCGVKLTSSYKDFQLCPPCSVKEQKCLICMSSTCMSHGPPPNSCEPASQGPPPMPQGQPQGSPGHGKQGNLPLPPPPPQSARQHNNQSPPDMQSARQPIGQSRQDVSSPDEASMYMSRPAVGHPGMPSQNYPAHSGAAPGQVFSTQLPPHMRNQASRAPWEQNQGAMSARPRMQGNHDPDEGFAGFLRFVAADIWKTCNNDNRQLDSPDRPFVRRGGA